METRNEMADLRTVTQANMPDEQVDELTSYGGSLHSLGQVTGLHRFRNLRSLCVHRNSLSRIQYLEPCTSLTDLNLSSNCIESLEGLSTLQHLRFLNLSNNRISSITGLEGLFSLERVILSHNYISVLAGIAALHHPEAMLSVLDLRCNRLANGRELAILAGCPRLRDLRLADPSYSNSVCRLPQYRSVIAAALPRLDSLDQVPLIRPAGSQTTAAAPAAPTSTIPATHSLPPGQPSPVYYPPHTQVVNPYPAVPATSSALYAQLPLSQQPSPPFTSDPAASAPHHQAGAPPYYSTPAEPQSGPSSAGVKTTPRIDVALAGYHNRRRAGEEAANQETMARLQTLEACVREMLEAPLTSAAALPADSPAHHLTTYENQVAHSEDTRRTAKPQRDTRRSAQLPEDSHRRPALAHNDEGRRIPLQPVRPSNVPSGRYNDQSKPNNRYGSGNDKQAPSWPAEARRGEVPKMEATTQTAESAREGEGAGSSDEMLGVLTEEADALRGALAALKAQLEDRNTADADHAAQMDHLQADRDDLLDQLAQANAEVDRVQVEMDAAQAYSEEARDTIAALRAQVEDGHGLQADLEADVAALREAAAAHDAALLQHKAAHDAALLQQKTEADAVYAAAMAKVGRLEQEGSSAVAALEAAREREAALQEQVQRGGSEAAQLRSQALDRTFQAANREQELAMEAQQARAAVEAHKKEAAEAGAAKALVDKELQRAQGQVQLLMEEHQHALDHLRMLHQQELKSALERDAAASETRIRHTETSVAQTTEERVSAALKEQMRSVEDECRQAIAESDLEKKAILRDLHASASEVERVQAERQRLEGALAGAREKERRAEALVGELTDVVQQQRDRLVALQQDRSALDQRLRHLHAVQDDCSKLQARVHDLEAAHRPNPSLQAALDQTRAEKEELQARVKQLESEAAAGPARQHALTEKETLETKVGALQDALKVKDLMLDSQNDTIAQLKAALAEDKEARRAAEEALAEAQDEVEEWARAERGELKGELERQERTIQQLEAALQQQQGAQADRDALRTELEEKNRLLEYVGDEVDQVKGLFSEKEEGLVKAREEAEEEAEKQRARAQQAEEELAALEEARAAARQAQQDAEAHLADLHLADQSTLQALQAEVEAHKAAAAAAEERAAEEERRAAAHVAEVESEMRQLLLALEQQKAASASKVQLLGRMLQELAASQAADPAPLGLPADAAGTRALQAPAPPPSSAPSPAHSQIVMSPLGQ